MLALDWAPDSAKFAILEPGFIRVYDVGTLAVKELALDPRVSAMAYTADGSAFAIASEPVGPPALLDVASGQITQEAPWVAFCGRGYFVAAQPAGNQIAVGNGGDTSDVDVWDLDRGKCIAAVVHHDGWITSLEYSPDGSRLLASFNPQVGEETLIIASSDMRQLCKAEGAPYARFSPDGISFASLPGEGSVTIWSTDSCQPLSTLAVRGYAADWDPSAKLMVISVAQKGIQVWDLARRAIIASAEWTTIAPSFVRFSPDGRFLLAADYGLGLRDSSVMLWSFSRSGVDSPAGQMPTPGG